ncbi:MAG: NAD(+)/NADH kinase [Oscillospiraceae bacterium]
MSRKVLIGCNDKDAASMKIAAEISEILRGAELIPCYAEESGRLAANGTEPVGSVSECFCAITVGGDGTILHYGHIAAKCGIPLLGVNTGRLGFMATLEPYEIQIIPEIILGDFKVGKRMTMRAEIDYADGRQVVSEALNDVVVSRISTSKLPEFCVSCGGAEVSRFRADGTIFSTPMGSTAYSLSAGGPIIAPDMQCIEFTALCPHTLFSRPMIFSAENIVTLTCEQYQNSRVSVSIDGHSGIEFGTGDILRLCRGEAELKVIETGEGFFGAVREKLMQPLK